jgi:hypothetical protein
VVHYSHAGERLWAFGRPGPGPEEFQHPEDLKVDETGRAWVLDARNARITVLGTDGRPVHNIPLTDVGVTPHEIVPLPGSGAMLVTSNEARPLLVVDSTGKIMGKHAFPWAGFSRMDYLATQLITASDSRSDRWVAAFRMGDGFFVFDGTRWSGTEGWFVEFVPFPEVEVTRTRNTTSTRHRERPITAARAIAFSSDRVYVLFGGNTADRNRVVDAYSVDDGKYVESYRLPEAARDIAWHDGGLYSITHDPYPQLTFWRPVGAPLP